MAAKTGDPLGRNSFLATAACVAALVRDCLLCHAGMVYDASSSMPHRDLIKWDEEKLRDALPL